MSYVVLISGSRGWTDEQTIYDVLSDLPKHAIVMHGRCPSGADAIADRLASHLGLLTITFPARWDTYGKRAGIVRNLVMLDYQPDEVIAFWDGESPGTKHVIEEARKRQIPVTVIP